MLPRASSSGRNSSLGGRGAFVSSVLDGEAAGPGAASGGVDGAAAAAPQRLPVSWEEAAALPQDQLLQLVQALQLDVRAASAQLEGERLASALVPGCGSAGFRVGQLDSFELQCGVEPAIQ